MLKFYSHKNSIFECKVKLEGATYKEVVPRLVLKDGNVSHTFDGKINSLGQCIVDVYPLTEMKGSEGEAILEIRVGDVVFEPYKTKYEVIKQNIVVSEAKIFDKIRKKKKQKLFVENISKTDKTIAFQLLETYKKLNDKDKKIIKEYVEFKYHPSADVKKWANNVFTDANGISAKIAMYEMEVVRGK